MCFHSLPNRRTWIPLNTYGISWITVCASDNLHLRPSINSTKCCNRNGEQYQETMWEIWWNLCRGGAEQYWPRVVVIHGTNFNVTGSVLNYDKLPFFLLILWSIDCKFFNNKHSESISKSVTEKFWFKIHVLKYLKSPYAFLFLQSVFKGALFAIIVNFCYP
jgi:hypothetical protein